MPCMGITVKFRKIFRLRENFREIIGFRENIREMVVRLPRRFRETNFVKFREN
jgi:hypothetical protein